MANIQDSGVTAREPEEQADWIKQMPGYEKKRQAYLKEKKERMAALFTDEERRAYEEKAKDE